jgi:hypothetical protein
MGSVYLHIMYAYKGMPMPPFTEEIQNFQEARNILQILTASDSGNPLK